MNDINHPKNQHYVPRFLLNNFQIDSTNQIYCYDKSNGNTFRTNIKNVACEKWFYDIDEGNPESSLEPALSKLEGNAASIINGHILKNCTLRGLVDEQYGWLSLFIAIQMLRTKNMMLNMKFMDDQMQKEFIKRGWDLDKIQNYKKIETEQELKEISLSNIKIARSLTPHILDKVWALFESKEEFIISDNPIGFQNTVNRDPLRGTIGVAVRGIEIYLPISPKYTIGLICRDTFTEMLDYFSNHYKELDRIGSFELRNFVNSIRRKIPIRCKEANIENLNSIQVYSSERFLFSKNDNFDLASEMIQKNIKIKHGPRSEMA